MLIALKATRIGRKGLTHDGGGVGGPEVVGGVQELVRVVHGVILLVRLHRRAHIRARILPVKRNTMKSTEMCKRHGTDLLAQA